MQKLGGRNTYTPTDASQVHSNCDSALNREETLSVLNLKTPPNNSDVNQQSGRTEHNLRVYVLNMRNKPLMPCTPAKTRHLLKEKKAKVVSIKPFTIQLLNGTGETKQEITLGIDAGYTNIGYSATTDKRELISGEIKLRTDISKKLIDKRAYRRNRRAKLWHRKARFMNRGDAKTEGRLTPSIKHKLDSHIRLVNKLKGLLPVTKTIIEVATFDPQKMQNPEISGVEYQQGELQGYNVREYLLGKFNRTCVYCKKQNLPLEIEHLTPKSRGGTNRVKNLAIACHKCNQRKGNKTAEEFGFPEARPRAEKSFKSAIFMNLVRHKIAKELDCDITYGYITKHNRIEEGLDKTHYNDAFIIANGNGRDRACPILNTQIKRNNRRLQINRKGFAPAIRRQRYKLQPNDVVLYKGKKRKIKGVHCKGKQVLLEKSKSINIKEVELMYYGKGMFA